MKTLVIPVEKKETKVVKKTKASIKRGVKEKMLKAINRTENLIDIYFELGLQNDLREDLKDIKTNGIEHMIDCFEIDDKSKLVSFLRKVFDLPYFVGVALKGITPQKLIDILLDLCTVKDGAKRNIKCNIVGEKSMFCQRPNEYNIEVNFDTKLIEMLFQAYI